jgi:hypothetical protein
MSRLLVFAWLIACSPETDLTGTPARPPPEAGVATAVTLLEPTPGATAPQNLAAVVLRLPAALGPEGAQGELRGTDGAPLALNAAMPVDCTGAGPCYAFALAQPVPPGRYLASLAHASFADGRTLSGTALGAFSIDTQPDTTPPTIDPPSAEAVGDCLRVRWHTDEPARGWLTVRAPGIEQVLAAGEGTMSFDLAARLVRLPPGLPAELVVGAVDWAGNRSLSGPVPITVPAATLPLAITEVLANPSGPEATQEFVELQNLGSEPLSLAGLTIEDATGSDPLPGVTLLPRAFAVVVPAAYDLYDGRDPAPRPGAVVVRVEGRIGRDGIGNAGEVVRLRRGGEVVSRYGGWIDSGRTGWTGRSVVRQPADACDDPVAWSARPQLPTPGW